MPSIIHGNIKAREVSAHVKFDYDYPDGLDLDPRSKTHQKLVAMLLEKARLSATHMSVRHGSWNEIDQYLTAYKWIDDEERDVKDSDNRRPVSLVFPYSYAVMETLLSYMIAAFGTNPIFMYEGYGPDDVLGSMLLEKIVQLHSNKFKVLLNLHTMWRDNFAYGFGAVTPTWKITSNGLHAGNALENIEPYRYLPDPNVPVQRIQEGEFVGWLSENNYYDLLSEEYNDEDLFNVKYLKEFSNRRSSIISGSPDARGSRTGETTPESETLSGLDELFMYMKIIPSDWGLGTSDRPEKWFFRLAADSVLISARPANFDHDMFPVAVCASDFDGYSSAPLSRLEIISGLQGTLDWLFNSHIANVRKAINDMIIYDPYAINSADLRDPKPGKLIRARSTIWGQGKLKDYVQQLQVNDITRGNISDSSWIIDGMQKVSAIDDSAMGVLRQGGPERLTKAEFQGTSAGAVSRLERIARVIGVQAMHDIGEMFASHTQQMMTDDMYVKIAGNWSEVLLKEFSSSVSRGRMKISPQQLDIFYDVIPRDGSLPGGNFSEVWIRMFETLASQPELLQEFDITKIFKHLARNAGAKNTEEFIRRQPPQMNASTMPNEEITQNVQQGNLVPFAGGA